MLGAFLVVLLYPIVIFFFPDWRLFRAAYRRAKAGRRGPFPPTLGAIAERRGRWFLLVKIVITGLLLLLWMRYYRFEYIDLGLQKVGLWSALATGMLGALFLVTGRIGFQTIFTRVRSGLSEHPLYRGRVGTWALTFFVGGFVEEVWRALSLSALQNAGFGTMFSVAAVSVAFLFAKLSGTPSRIPGTLTEALWEVLLGAVLAGLFLKTKTVVAPYIAGLLFNTANIYLVRHLGRSPGERGRSDAQHG